MRQIIRDIFLSNPFIAENQLVIGVIIFILLLLSILGVVVFTIIRD